MIDANYFRTHLPKEVEELGGCAARAEIYLHNGMSISVRRLGDVGEGYVRMEVYPEEGEGEKDMAARRKRGGTDEVSWDRIALAYEAIAKVVVTVKSTEERPVMGFSNNSSGELPK